MPDEQQPSPAAAPPPDLGFDPDALRRRYRDERDRRLRADGNEQYVEIKGELAHFLDDPYAEPGFTRAALYDDVEVLIVGAGREGLLIEEKGAAARRLP